MLDNLLLMTDSYKFSHSKQYPPKTTNVYSYLEARVEDRETLFFGLQYILKKYLCGQVVTRNKLNEAETFVNAHMGPNTFNKLGWEYILIAHGGYLPIRIRAVPEGTIVNSKNVLMTIENTDPNCYWLTNYLETLLMQVWYPITVASQSREFRKVIYEYLVKTGTPDDIFFKLHDFGYRGVSSSESAAIGGAAHLVNFMGSDTVAGILMLQDFYGATEMPAFSIPASEHSTITSWGQEHEVNAMENMLDTYPTGLVACVSDSFDIYKACGEYWGDQLRDKVLQRDGTLIVRPDSGDPKQVVLSCLNILGDKFNYTLNSKGYKVLPPQIRLIQGDGIDLEMCKSILAILEQERWSADNIAFGSGGALLQKMNRDTYKFAIKCSSISADGREREVYKQPIDEPFKISKKGRLKLINMGYRYTTVSENDSAPDVLVTVYEQGEMKREYTIDEIRARAARS